MAVYEFPGLGTFTTLRKSPIGFGFRYRYDVSAVDADGNKFSSWITVPDDWSEDQIVSAALDAIACEVAEFTGDDTGNMWGVYSGDIEEGDEFAASYRVNGVSHYRVQPFSYDRDGDVFETLSDIESSWKNGYLFQGYPDPGDEIDVYTNNDDEPSHRLIYGRRGGITRTKW